MQGSRPECLAGGSLPESSALWLSIGPCVSDLGSLLIATILFTGEKRLMWSHCNVSLLEDFLYIQSDRIHKAKFTVGLLCSSLACQVDDLSAHSSTYVVSNGAGNNFVLSTPLILQHLHFSFRHLLSGSSSHRMRSG